MLSANSNTSFLKRLIDGRWSSERLSINSARGIRIKRELQYSLDVTGSWQLAPSVPSRQGGNWLLCQHLLP